MHAVRHLLTFILSLILLIVLSLVLLPFVLLLALIPLLFSGYYFLRHREKKRPPKGTIEILPAEKTAPKAPPKPSTEVEIEAKVEPLPKRNSNDSKKHSGSP